jgi:hypothetical protein
MPTNGDRHGDNETSEQPPSLPPPVEGNEDGEGRDGQQRGPQITNDENGPPHWTRYVEAVCALALVLITGTYTYYASKQASASVTAADAAKSAADTASQTLQQMKDSSTATSQATLSAFKQEQRPYIVATAFSLSPSKDGLLQDEKGTHFCLRVEEKNRGRTPAVSVWDHRSVTYGKSGEDTVRTMKTPKYPGEAGEVMGPDTDSSGPYADACTEPLDEKTISDIANGRVDVFIYGSIQYGDMFGDFHETRFCGERPAGFSVFNYCKYGNWIDKKPQKHK